MDLENLNLKQHEAEFSAKAHMRQQYQTHRTSIDSYEMPDRITIDNYYSEVYQTGLNIARYVLVYEGEQKYRDYISTSTIDA